MQFIGVGEIYSACENNSGPVTIFVAEEGAVQSLENDLHDIIEVSLQGWKKPYCTWLELTLGYLDWKKQTWWLFRKHCQLLKIDF